MSLFNELKRRNVFKVGTAYLVLAWIVIQIADAAVPALRLPEWVNSLVFLLGILGFPFAIFFAWAFEMTPDGIKKESEIDRGESITQTTGKKLEYSIIGLLVIALGYFVWNGQKDDKVNLVEQSAVIKPAPSEIIKTNANTQVEKINPHSIAVLPFTNMSGDKDNEYFSDGISEEILNVLARTSELQVAARTSSFSFKGKAIEIADIAEALNVRMVLEGSVRKQGDKVRITAQLIDASNGFHLWSETYDRKLVDIFVIQDEIAKAIGEQLKIKMTGLAKPGETVSGTQNIEAYDLYLRGMALWQTRVEKSLWQAVELFEQATTLDPAFVQAYSGLALTYAIIGDYSNRMSYANTLVHAENFAELAIALDPTQAEAYVAMSMVASTQKRSVTADTLMSRAIKLRPSFATAYQWRGGQLMTKGELNEALTSFEQASLLDPRSRIVGENHSYILLALGRFTEAKARCFQVLEFYPNFTPCMEDIGVIELQLGNFSVAQTLFEKMVKIYKPSVSTQFRDLIEALRGNGDKHKLAVRYASFAANSASDPDSDNVLTGFYIPPILVLLGEYQLSLDYLEGMTEEAGSGSEWAVVLPLMDPIRCQPRFIAVVKKLKMHDPHFAKVCGENS